MATEAGIEVVAPVHDAMMIMAPLDCLDRDIERTRTIMAHASEALLGGFRLRTDCAEFNEDGTRVEFPHIIRYPDRYMDKGGAVMWARVMELLEGEKHGE
jgi:DNA polymerase I